MRLPVRAFLDVCSTRICHESWPGIAYFRVKPVWLRYSDFRGSEPKVLTFDGASLRDFDEAAARVSDPDVGSGDRVTRFLG